MNESEKKTKKKDSKESIKYDNCIFCELKNIFNNYIAKTSIEIEKKEENNANPSEISSNANKTEKTVNNSDSESSQKDHHKLPGSDKIFELEHKIIDSFKSERFTWVNITILVIGILLIIFGIIVLSGSSEKVADNVVFGERAVLAVFIILIGIVVVSIAMAYKLLNKTFLDKLFNDIKLAEKKSEDVDKSNSNVSKKK
ncbi:MAG: hypothetical protein QME14_02015 [Methanobacteriaceae archaeon]|nr:hypothetical protein [Methanobacteriaceae archaeon]